MNEELEPMIKKIESLREDWNEEKTLDIAYELEWILTKIKLIIGIQNFDSLTAFYRLLDDVSRFICNFQKNNPPYSEKVQRV